MKTVTEIVLLVAVLVSGFQLPTTNFIILVGASVGLYCLTMYNSFRDGYDQAIEDRIY